MSNMWSYDRNVVYCIAANTTFLRLGLNYSNYVETGLYHTTSSTPVGFTSWAINGDATAVPESVSFPNNDFYSFVLTPYTGSFWKSEYDASGNQSSWTLMEITPLLAASHGLSESEVSRFHGQDGRGSYTSLKYRPSTGGWFLWGALACDPNIGGIDNWDAVKTSNSSWYMRSGAPPPGDC